MQLKENTVECRKEIETTEMEPRKRKKAVREQREHKQVKITIHHENSNNLSYISKTKKKAFHMTHHQMKANLQKVKIN